MDLRKIADNADEPQQSVKKAEKPLTSREIQFTLLYDSGAGEREAVLTSRVMTGDERFKASRIAADIAGRPWNLLPVNVQVHAVSLGTIAVQLRDCPDWVLNAAQEDEELAVMLFTSCRGHDDRWYKRSGQEGTEGETGARIRIVETGIAPLGNE
tara:strand:+ start:5909 stop:6373 length:465 start_codon:yes stop_codon:yes gene_type:complete